MRAQLLFVAIFLFPGLALADVGECAAPEAMTAKLKAEDQHSIVTADFFTTERRMFAAIVTTSTDRQSGYVIKADQPLGERAGQLCIYARLAAIRLFDGRRAGVPPAVLLRAPDDDAASHCDRLAKAGEVRRDLCWPLNSVIRRNEAIAQRVIVQGQTLGRVADGSYKPDGTLLTLTGKIGGSMNDDDREPANGILGHIYYSALPDGATVQNAVLVYVTYTPYGLGLLN